MYDEVVERLRCQISTTRMHTSQLVSCVPSCSIRLVYVWELRLQLLYELVVCIVCIHIIYIISCILRARSILLPVVYTSKRNTSRMHILLSIMREYNTSSSLYIYLVYIVRISYRIVSYRIESSRLRFYYTPRSTHAWGPKTAALFNRHSMWVVLCILRDRILLSHVSSRSSTRMNM